MKKSQLDWLENCLFLMIACAEITDYHLSEDEIEEIDTKALQLLATIPGASKFTKEDLTNKITKTLKWYNYIGDMAPEGAMDEAILEEINTCANFLKAQDWFSPLFAQSIISDLIDIAKADGEVIKDEQHIINSIAGEWGVAKPFLD